MFTRQLSYVNIEQLSSFLYLYICRDQGNKEKINGMQNSVASKCSALSLDNAV
jgi:hypothetical protein